MRQLHVAEEELRNWPTEGDHFQAFIWTGKTWSWSSEDYFILSLLMLFTKKPSLVKLSLCINGDHPSHATISQIPQPQIHAEEPKREVSRLEPPTIKFLTTLLILVFVNVCALAYDPSPLQDFCVAVNSTKDAVFINGKFCKDPKLASADDFAFTGFRAPGNTSNPLGSKVTPAFVDQFPGINTLGISIAKIDFSPYGLNPPHSHPRGTEILAVVESALYVGFVASKVLYPGDVFVFPIGLIHFQFNIDNTNAVAFAGLSSQNPGVMTIANSVFGSQPPISSDVLTKAFQVEKDVVKYLQSQFWWDNYTRLDTNK